MSFKDLLENKQILTEMDLLMDGLDWRWSPEPPAELDLPNFKLYYESPKGDRVTFSLIDYFRVEAVFNDSESRIWSDFGSMEVEIGHWLDKMSRN